MSEPSDRGTKGPVAKNGHPIKWIGGSQNNPIEIDWIKNDETLNINDGVSQSEWKTNTSGKQLKGQHQIERQSQVGGAPVDL